jgi:hypothetical protein
MSQSYDFWIYDRNGSIVVGRAFLKYGKIICILKTSYAFCWVVNFYSASVVAHDRGLAPGKTKGNRPEDL